MTGRAVRVLFVSSCPHAAAWLGRVLDAAAGLELVERPVDQAAAPDRVRARDPDVVLTETRSGTVDVPALTARLATPAGRRPVVLVLADGREGRLAGGIPPQVEGVLLDTRLDLPQLVSAVQLVAAGYRLRLPDPPAGRPPAPAPDGQDRLHLLTPRELEVLLLVARGLSDADISRALLLGKSTVKSHVRHLLDKLGLPSRTRAAVLAYESGLVAAQDGTPEGPPPDGERPLSAHDVSA